jgi:GT2 family glycosyltransferase
MPKPRVLVATTVYNGRAFVPACLQSATRLAGDEADVDVLVLDDASPAPGWSDELAGICRELGIGYYCTPRNLGIVRNVNLSLLRALAAGYDYVVVSNSDVIYPATMVTQLVRVARADPTIGSVTSWSNNVSVYSLPNDNFGALASTEVVDECTAALTAEFGTEAMDIPAGISFAMLISTEALRAVGLMDPVFGRGYCEESDWSLRSVQAGFRLTLAPSVFVYHAGRGSTVEAGLLGGGHTTVPANEAIIDMRYPTFRETVETFVTSGVLQGSWERGLRAVVGQAARAHGYVLDIAWLHRPPAADDDAVRCVLQPDGRSPLVAAHWRGFTAEIELDPSDPVGSIRSLLGGDPRLVARREQGAQGDLVASAFGKAGVEVRDSRSYPERV